MKVFFLILSIIVTLVLIRKFLLFLIEKIFDYLLQLPFFEMILEQSLREKGYIMMDKKDVDYLNKIKKERQQTKISKQRD